MKALEETAPHFIRCVKSNSQQKPDILEAPLCLRQLKYAGLFEAIRIRKSGYAYRSTHDYFVKKYYLLATGHYNSDKEYAEAILSQLQEKSKGKLTEFDYAVGNTKVFIKSREPNTYIEEQRNLAIKKHVVIVQSFFRMGLAKMNVFAAKYEVMRKKKEIERAAKEEAEKLAKIAKEEEDRKREIEEKARIEREAKSKIEREEREAREKVERVEREAREKIEEEERRVAIAKTAKSDKAVRAIQGVCRIFHAKRVLSVMKSQRMLNDAILSRDQDSLHKAIKKNRSIASYNRKVSNLIDHAREVLEEVLDEMEIKAEIEEAI